MNKPTEPTDHSKSIKENKDIQQIIEKKPSEKKTIQQQENIKRSIPYDNNVNAVVMNKQQSKEQAIEVEPMKESDDNKDNPKQDTMKSLPSSTQVNPEVLEKKKHALEQITTEQFIKTKGGSYATEYKMGKVLGEGR